MRKVFRVTRAASGAIRHDAGISPARAMPARLGAPAPGELQLEVLGLRKAGPVPHALAGVDPVPDAPVPLHAVNVAADRPRVMAPLDPGRLARVLARTAGALLVSPGTVKLPGALLENGGLKLPAATPYRPLAAPCDS